MSDYTDQDVPIECAECSERLEEVLPTVEHLLSIHNYTQEEAANFARLWADDVYERFELEDLERADFFKTHGYDIEDIDRDD